MHVSKLKSMVSVCFKRNTEFKQFKNLKSYIYIMNPSLSGTQAYS